MVHHRIACCVKKRDVLPFCEGEQLPNHLSVVGQLVTVFLPKGVETVRTLNAVGSLDRQIADALTAEGIMRRSAL